MQRLRELAQTAACIVVEVGNSENLRWEFEEIMRGNLHEKLFVITRPQDRRHLSRGSYLFERMLSRIKGIETVSWTQFAAELRTMNYKLSGEDPRPGDVVAFDQNANGVTLTTKAELPDDFVAPICCHLQSQMELDALDEAESNLYC
jgi:hypothetical protein